ncbi:MAG: HEAT repeat domain-containing protein [Planctomycetota bacterium]|jgi:hypothetical protein
MTGKTKERAPAGRIVSLRRTVLYLCLSAFICGLFSLSLGAQDEEARIRELLKRLEADELPTRAAAARELAQIGRPVLPFLEKLEKSGDPELRGQALAIRGEIAELEVLHARWRPGKRVTLEAEDRPVAEILSAIADQAGQPVEREADALKGTATLALKDEPFFGALFALCRAAGNVTPEFTKEGVRIVAGAHAPRPLLVRDEFAVWVERVHTEETYRFTGAPSESFDVEIRAAWEHHVRPVTVDLRLETVEDDQGTELLIRNPAAMYRAPAETEERHRAFRLRGYLAPPGKDVRKIALLKGEVTFLFPLRFETASIDLTAPPGEEIELGRMRIHVQNVQTVGKVAVDFEIRIAREAGAFAMPSITQEALSIVDDRGGAHPVRLMISSQSWGSGETNFRYKASGSLPAGRTPASLRIRLLQKSRTMRAPFAFRDIPVP